MGHSVWADVVPFVMHEVYLLDDRSGLQDLASDEERALVDPDNYLDGAHLTDEEFETWTTPESLEFRGWKYDPDDQTPLGKKSRIWGHTWRKGSYAVWLVNESEYSNIGDYRMAVCSNDRASIEAFKADFAVVFDPRTGCCNPIWVTS